MSYTLSIAISGPGTTERAHWGFTLHQPPNTFGDLLHVRLIDLPSKRFQFENRTGHGLSEQDAWGLATVTTGLTGAQRVQVVSILEAEKPPVGEGKCQDWAVDALVALEVEELVPDGTAERWAGRVGVSTGVIRHELEREGRGAWVSLNGR